ncbi:MAG: uridine kinase [Alteromonadaceae bacterium]|nr:uridine kinase [Alteromonadaceae bacterium]
MPNNKQTIIAIVGASASGKSLFAQTIYEELLPELGDDNIAIIKEDCYYRSQDQLSLTERSLINYDHPAAFEHELLAEHLTLLSQQNTVAVPTYSYTSHTRLTDTKMLSPAKVILVEGILLLEDKQLRDLFDIKIFMDIPLDICLLRRIKRDMIERERSLESITQQYMETVRPMYYQYIEPSKAYADIIITQGGKNRMAIEVLKAKIRQLVQ